MNFNISLLAGAMAAALSLPAAAHTSPDSAPGSVAGMTAVATAYVRLRAGPGTRHAKVTVIPEGARLEVGECGPGWCEVDYAGKSGYVWAKYLEAAIEAPAAAEVEPAAVSNEEALAAEQPPAATDKWVLQTSSEFELRAGPGSEHDAIGVIPEGSVLAVEECIPGWCQVTLTGYIEIVAAAAPPRAASTPQPPAAAKTAIAEGDLHLRAGAGMKHRPIDIIPAGATVEIGDCISGRVWCEVTYGERTGYASRRYLDQSL